MNWQEENNIKDNFARMLAHVFFLGCKEQLNPNSEVHQMTPEEYMKKADWSKTVVPVIDCIIPAYNTLRKENKKMKKEIRRLKNIIITEQ